MKRTNSIIFALVVALFAYITIQDRFSLSTGETTDRASRVVPGMVRARLAFVEVERGDARYRIESTGRDHDGDPTFRFVRPFQAEVDADQMLSALSAAEWADPVRTLTGVDAAARRRFGLDRPRLVVRFGVANAVFDLRFGGAEARGAGVYAQSGENVFVVSNELFQAFDQPAVHFRNKRFGTSLPADPQRITVHSPDADVDLRREATGWHMASPFSGTASEGRANVVLAFMRTIAATRFVDEAPRDLARYGLDAPSLRVTVAGIGSGVSASLSVGGACEGAAGERYARAERGPVVCVSDAEIAPLRADVRSYLELRALETEASGVVGVDLHDGTATLSVVDREGAFQFVFGQDRGTADADAVSEWLDALRATRATEVAPLPSDFVANVTLTVHRTETRTDELMRFMRVADGGWLARRNEDSLVLRFDGALTSRLEVTTVHVRARGLLHEDPSDIDEVTVTRADSREVLRRSADGALELVEPAIPTEVARSTDLMMRLAGLEAVRFVSDRTQSLFGLDAPRFVVTFKLARTDGTTVSHRLEVGAPMPDGQGGAYACLDDAPSVFELVGATVDLLSTPLASRQLLSTESLFVDAIEVRSGAREVRLIRSGTQFVAEAGSVDQARAQAAVNAVADLVAARVAGYGPPASDLGFARPLGEFRVRRGADGPQPRDVAFVIGARRVGEADGAELVAIRRADVAATFLVSFASVEPILAIAR